MKGRARTLTLRTVALVVALAGPANPVSAACEMRTLAELPVTMTGAHPMVSAKINGADATFIADSGAFYSMMSPNAAAEFNLQVQSLPNRVTVSGVGGSSLASYTTIKAFSLGRIPFSGIDFLVAGSDLGDGAAGLIGQNILGVTDVEYDLANGVIRLIRPRDCRGTVFAYWATDRPYSVMDIEFATRESQHMTGIAYLNGERIRVLFDTGAAHSDLTLRAAESAGRKPGDPGVVPAGYSHGIGQRAVQTYVAPFDSFKIGEEQINHTRLRFGAIALQEADMLIGADFFLSHRVYVAKSQRKLYFTYNGGPVFNLDAVPLSVQHAQEPGPTPSPATADDASTPQPGSAPAAGSAELPDQPQDAAGFSRRGAAFAARHDFAHAIADLTHACELAPNESQYFYLRGMAFLGNRQPFQAMTDFDQALKIKPDDVPTRVARSELRLDGRDPSAAAEDLDAVDREVPKNADARLSLANLYARTGRLESAIAQFDQWLPSHPQDPRRFEALIGRCRGRGLLGQDLQKALSDCNDAVRLNPRAPRALDSRGLVRLRMGDFDKSIADYDAALSLAPKLAWSLYGRGLDEVRKGMTSKGQADMAAAAALQPAIANEARHFGLTP